MPTWWRSTSPRAMPSAGRPSGAPRVKEMVIAGLFGLLGSVLAVAVTGEKVTLSGHTVGATPLHSLRTIS
jgi:hypothetical protein